VFLARIVISSLDEEYFPDNEGSALSDRRKVASSDQGSPAEDEWIDKSSTKNSAWFYCPLLKNMAPGANDSFYFWMRCAAKDPRHRRGFFVAYGEAVGFLEKLLHILVTSLKFRCKIRLKRFEEDRDQQQNGRS
jgi:hypothetical protein